MNGGEAKRSHRRRTAVSYQAGRGRSQARRSKNNGLQVTRYEWAVSFVPFTESVLVLPEMTTCSSRKISADSRTVPVTIARYRRRNRSLLQTRGPKRTAEANADRSRKFVLPCPFRPLECQALPT